MRDVETTKAIMTLPFLHRKEKQRDQVISIDLGARTTKAVHIQRNGDRFALTRYAVLDAPIYEKSMTADLLTEHLKGVCLALEARTRNITLALGVGDSLVRHAELPRMPAADMRQVLKNNPKNYLQQDLPGYLFDCFILSLNSPGGKEAEKKASVTPKCKVLVAGAKKQTVDEIQTAVKNSGLTADRITPGLIGPVNAFELSFPENFQRDLVALVDIGFKSTTICLVQQGELMLSRVVNIGGDKLTHGLSENLGISYAEAEGIKVGMPSEVEAALESMVTPLGRELRASIDFFEHQHDKTVSKVYISGASARSEFILKTLHTELMVECLPWNPVSFMDMALSPQQTAEIEQLTPQLTVAVGAAMASF
jgi:type IV pilus assembly protein PilM